jgi:hypothetical protein
LPSETQKETDMVAKFKSKFQDAFDTVVVLTFSAALMAICRANERHRRARQGR